MVEKEEGRFSYKIIGHIESIYTEWRRERAFSSGLLTNSVARPSLLLIHVCATR